MATKKQSSSESSSSSDENQKKTQPTQQTNPLLTKAKEQKKSSSSSSSSDEPQNGKSSTIQNSKPAVISAVKPVVTQKKQSSSSSSSDKKKPKQSQTNKQTPIATKQSVIPVPNKQNGVPKANEESSSSSSSEDPPVVQTKQLNKTGTEKQDSNPVTKQAPKQAPSTITKTVPTQKKESSSSSSSSEDKPPKVVQPNKQPPIAPTQNKTVNQVKKESSSSSSSDDNEKPQLNKQTATKKAQNSATQNKVVTQTIKKSSSEESSSEEMHVVKPPPTNNKDIKMTDVQDTKGQKRKKPEESGNNFNKKRKLEGGSGKTKVRLGNLSFELDGQIDEIKSQFKDCGNIVNVEMISRTDGRFAGVAILEFETEDAASKALEMNDQEFYGRKMNISYSNEAKSQNTKGISEKPEGCTAVFIGNLNFEITEDQVWELFQDCGDIKECRWPQGDFNGFGWVEFYNTDSTDKAVKKNGNNVLGRPIRVDYAAPRKSRF
jgi:nucleolin